MLDSLVGTILTDARTVLEDLDPFLLELEVSAERADASLLSTIYNTTPILSNCFSLPGLADAAVLVDLLQLVTGAFRKKQLALSSIHIREVIRAFSALVAFLDDADTEKISNAIDALRSLVQRAWPDDAKSLLAQNTLRSPDNDIAFSVTGYALQDDFMQESMCYVLELDDTGMLAGTQFTPFSLLQFLYKSGQILGVRFAPPESGTYLEILFATVLTEEQLQMVLDIPAQAIHQVGMESFNSPKPAWTARYGYASEAQNSEETASEAGDVPSVQRQVRGTEEQFLGKENSGSQSVTAVPDPALIPTESSASQLNVQRVATQEPASSDAFALLEAELEGELFEEALSAGITAHSLNKAQQELPEQITSSPSAADVSSAPAEKMYGFDVSRDGNFVTLEVAGIQNSIEAEELRAALLELLSSHADIELVLQKPVGGNLELLQLLLSAAMTAGLRRQQFSVTGVGKKSVGTLLAGCGITTDILKAQGIADFLG
ncbi:hypothetical protein [Halodesulfovibrio spirochaetisodalis]|uniref:Uncharacterized protein n=1 Tax=Halodesulfovibrio spirochaetisodalis TaxID=1560234 RepID=A0A1B7XQ62_9BACT|nr:hypothetical protein [Halodesulfovibrio spirochaetisodalis]OBQ57652.1 hypothetical protein SP90_01030 [Halodesulfovibrio spirochaetisodalis]